MRLPVLICYIEVLFKAALTIYFDKRIKKVITPSKLVLSKICNNI